MRLIYPGPWWTEEEINSCSKVFWSWLDDGSKTKHNFISACWQLNTGIPTFWKCAWHHFAFTKPPTLVLDFTNRSLKRNFAFVEKGEIRKERSASVSRKLLHRQCTRRAARVAPPSSLQNYTQHLSIKSPWPWAVHEHLCFISICFCIH